MFMVISIYKYVTGCLSTASFLKIFPFHLQNPICFACGNLRKYRHKKRKINVLYFSKLGTLICIDFYFCTYTLVFLSKIRIIPNKVASTFKTLMCLIPFSVPHSPQPIYASALNPTYTFDVIKYLFTTSF